MEHGLKELDSVKLLLLPSLLAQAAGCSRRLWRAGAGPHDRLGCCAATLDLEQL